ncbi:hypothetical protein [Corynebacterium occultum]|uniref:hypothetical protein n=1 Tax=Corynebacterium occultum TaxID=2675219 RepID=UPI0012E30FB6|nr:hypothetical protein [Corynebacterium occultum]
MRGSQSWSSPLRLRPTIDSLKLPHSESEEIRTAIGENNVRALANHRDMLRLTSWPGQGLDQPGSGRQVR